MIYALDTNIISYLLKDDETVYSRYFDTLSKGNQCTIPLIAYYEVRRGLEANDAASKMRSFEKICVELDVYDLTIEDVSMAASIYADRKNKGKMIDDADILIAAQCITNGYTLVTNNTKHFENIEGLRIVNWVE